MEDDEHWKLQIDGGYVTGLYIISNDAPTPSSTLLRRRWGGEVAPKPVNNLNDSFRAMRPLPDLSALKLCRRAQGSVRLTGAKGSLQSSIT